MRDVKITGGARVGMINATWPFATLEVSADKLELKASLIGNFVFAPDDIVSIEPFIQFPLIGQGIKINHNVPTYNEKVIFWCFSNPVDLINRIKETGFLEKRSVGANNADWGVMAGRQKQGGFPLKMPFAIGMVVAWNVLFITDFIHHLRRGLEGVPFGNGTITALALVFGTCTLTLISKGFQRIVLKEGRDVSEIARFLYLLMIITGFMIVTILFFPK